MTLKVDTILIGDAVQELKKLPDECVDMFFADPPFNLKKKYNKCKDDLSDYEYMDWCRLWLREAVRITKFSGSIFIHNIPKWLICYANYLNSIAYFRHWIAWDAVGNPMGKTLLPYHYGILYYTKSNSYKDFKFYDVRAPHKRCRKCNEYVKDYGGKTAQMHPLGNLLSDVWTDIHRVKHNGKRDDHPCQLPIPLLERIILMSTDNGDIVLDPFMGTGTTAVAAKRMGRKYIGIEIDEKYVKIANDNISKNRESKVNGCYVSMYLDKIATVRSKDSDQVLKMDILE